MEAGNNGATFSREVELAAGAERRRFTAEYKLDVSAGNVHRRYPSDT